MLRLEGYEPLMCPDATNVVDRIRQDQPDLLLLDAMMPQLDGIQVLKQIASSNLSHKPPVLLLTGNADDHYLRRALESGASGLVVKPFVKEDLLERLQSILGKP
jgi:CheY-like chemotaxis protein